MYGKMTEYKTDSQEVADAGLGRLLRPFTPSPSKVDDAEASLTLVF